MAPGRRVGALKPVGPHRWEIRVFLGKDASGTRQYRAAWVDGTKTQAEEALRTLSVELRGTPAARHGRTTVGAFFDTWLATHHGIAGSTRRTYRFFWDRYFAPSLGSLTLGEVTLETLEAVQGRLTTHFKLAPRSIRRVMSLPVSLFRAAAERRMIAASPSLGLRKPKVSTRRPPCWSPEELRTFLQKTKDTRWGPLWWLLGTSGLRPGEALALARTDLVKDRAQVTKSLTRGEQGALEVGPTKTNTMRSVVLPKTTMALLRRHIAVSGDGKGTFLFATRVGTPFQVNNVAAIFKATSAALGMPHVTLYSLRHAHATDLLSRGVHPKIVAERLGHSTIAMTLDTYSHVLPSMQDQTASDLDTSLEDL